MRPSRSCKAKGRTREKSEIEYCSSPLGYGVAELCNLHAGNGAGATRSRQFSKRVRRLSESYIERLGIPRVSDCGGERWKGGRCQRIWCARTGKTGAG